MNKISSLLPEKGLLGSFLRKRREISGDTSVRNIQLFGREKVSKLLTKTQETTSLKKAQEIMGENLFCGPDRLQKFWGIAASKVPPVPYSEALLARARDKNMSLQYFPSEIGSHVSAYELEAKIMRHTAKIYPHGIPNGLNHPLRIERDSLAKTQEENTLEKALREKQHFSSGWRLIQSGDIGRGKSMEEQSQTISVFEEDILHGEDTHHLNLKNESSSEAYFRMNNQLLMRLPVSATITESQVTGKFGFEAKSHHKGGPDTSYALGLHLAGEGVMGFENPILGIGAVDSKTHQYVGQIGHSYHPGDTWPKTIVI